MLKKMSRYKNHILSVVVALSIVIGGVCSNSLVSNAAFFEYTMNCAEPAKTDNNGYIVLLMHDSSNGSYFPHIYAWNAYSASGDENGDRALYNAVTEYVFVGSSFIEFGPSCLYGEYTLVAHSIYEIDEESIFRMKLSSKSERFRMDYGETITCVDYKIYGNGYVSYDGVGGVGDWNVYFDDSEDCRILRDIYTLLLNMSGDTSSDVMNNTLSSISGKLDALGSHITAQNNKLDVIEKSLDNFKLGLYSRLEGLGANVATIKERLNSIEYTMFMMYEKMLNIHEEQQKQTSWLEKIWNSIQEFFGTSDEDKQKGEDFKEESNEQAGQLSGLNEQNKTEKVDINSATSSVDGNIDENAIRNYGVILSVFTNHEHILGYLSIVFSLGLVAYVLFGKRG